MDRQLHVSSGAYGLIFDRSPYLCLYFVHVLAASLSEPSLFANKVMLLYYIISCAGSFKLFHVLIFILTIYSIGYFRS